jgi:hypothetical protein
LRILLYLKEPDIEIVVVAEERAPRFGYAHGRAVFSEHELDAVLDLKPSASEFRVICAAKMAINGIVAHDSAGDEFVAPVSGYSDDDALYL